MKKIKGETVTRISTTQDKFETVDGKIFYDKKDAIIHEDELKVIEMIIKKYKIKNIDPYIYGINVNNDYTIKSLYIENLEEDTLNDLRIYYPYLNTYSGWINEIKLGINIILTEEYDSCSIG